MGSDRGSGWKGRLELREASPVLRVPWGSNATVRFRGGGLRRDQHLTTTRRTLPSMRKNEVASYNPLGREDCVGLQRKHRLRPLRRRWYCAL